MTVISPQGPGTWIWSTPTFIGRDDGSCVGFLWLVSRTTGGDDDWKFQSWGESKREEHRRSRNGRDDFSSSRESPFSPGASHQKALIFISMFDSVSGQDFSYLGSCSLSINAYVFRVRFSSFNGSFTPVLWWKKLGTLTSRDHRADQGSYTLPRVSTPTRRARSVRSTEFNSTSFVSHAQRSREARGRACCRFPPLRENKSLRVRGENSARW